jgi:hypothetical protein
MADVFFEIKKTDLLALLVGHGLDPRSGMPAASV